MTLIVGLGAMALAHHLTRPAGMPADPEVTGSIGIKAQATRLDPCALRGTSARN